MKKVVAVHSNISRSTLMTRRRNGQPRNTQQPKIEPLSFKERISIQETNCSIEELSTKKIYPNVTLAMTNTGRTLILAKNSSGSLGWQILDRTKFIVSQAYNSLLNK